MHSRHNHAFDIPSISPRGIHKNSCSKVVCRIAVLKRFVKNTPNRHFLIQNQERKHWNNKLNILKLTMKIRPFFFASFEQISYIAVVFQGIPMSAMTWHFKSAIENLIDMAIFFDLMVFWINNSLLACLGDSVISIIENTPRKGYKNDTVFKSQGSFCTLINLQSKIWQILQLVYQFFDMVCGLFLWNIFYKLQL